MAAFDLGKAIRDAAPGSTVQVPAGTYAVNVEISKPLTLIAAGAVVIDGKKKGACVRVVGAATVAKLVGFTFFEGAAESGGGVDHREGTLTLQGCKFERGAAPGYGGGGLYTAGERCEVRACRFIGNTGRQGGAILADEVVSLVVRDSVLAQNAATQGGAIRVKEGAQVELLGCTIADNKVVGEKVTGSAAYVGGTMTRTPSLAFINCIVTERTKGPELIHNQGPHLATLTVRKCLLSESASALGGDNAFTADPRFSGNQREPYALHFKSPAVGAADAKAYGENAKDILGWDRVHDGKAEVGAFAVNV